MTSSRANGPATPGPEPRDPPPGGAPGEVRAAFVFDANRCTGCQACQLACVIENDLPLDAGWRQVLTFNERHLPDLPLFHLSLACNHCDAPACMDACPARAYARDPLTGAVLIDEDRCIGCGYCSWACPYDAPRLDRDRGVMTKCTFCNHRLREGQRPACAALCPTGALEVRDLPAAERRHDVDGFPPSDLGPSIRIVPLRDGAGPPSAGATVGAPSAGERAALRAAPTARRTDVRSEAPLVFFSLMAAVLVAIVVGAAPRGASVTPAAFAAWGAAAMLAGSLHLGRKLRAWRAVLGIRRSWLSREIVLYPAFVALGTAFLARPGSRALQAAAVATGLLTLLAVDRVYRFRVTTALTRFHSASALLTGLYLTALLAGSAPAAWALGVLRLGLYAARKLDRAGRGEPVRPILSAVRVASFAAPLILGLDYWRWTMALVPVGEVIDRGEFYDELDFPSPARQMAADLERRRLAR